MGAERAGQGRPELFKVTSGVVAETMIDTIDSIEEAGETDFLIIDLEGTAGEIVGYAIGRSDLTVIPMSASSMDARQAAKASQLVKRMAKTFKIDLPYVFAFCRTNAAIVTREHKGIIEQLEAHKEPVLGVDLKERSAYRAIFTEGATVTELTENKSGSIAKAQTNAVSFTHALYVGGRVMDLGFGDTPELKIPAIAPKKKRPVIESNDARVAEVNAKAGFSHPTEQAKRKRGRPAVSAKKPYACRLPPSC